MPRMVLRAAFFLAAVAMLGLLNVACSNDRASTSHCSSMLVSYGTSILGLKMRDRAATSYIAASTTPMLAATPSIYSAYRRIELLVRPRDAATNL